MKQQRTNMTWLVVGALAISAYAANSYGEAQAYDGFSVPASYADGKPLAGLSGGTGFAGAWSVSGSASVNNAGRYLASADSPAFTDKKGKSLQIQPGSMNAKRQGEGKGGLVRELKQEMKGTIWISFLTRIDEQIGYGWDIQFLDSNEEMQVKFMNGRAEENRWRIQSMKTGTDKPKNGLFKSKPGMTPTDPTLVILRIENAGSGSADGEVTAYLNPTDLRDAELSAMESLKISGLQINAITRFSFDKKTAATGYIDELRFGASLEDVLPQQ